MIKHEEVREMVIWGRIIHQDTEKARETLLDYITEQEKKDELLELYRKLNATQLNYDICDNEHIKSNLMNDIGNLKYVIKCLESEIARRK